jgi:hypothetical protein
MVGVPKDDRPCVGLYDAPRFQGNARAVPRVTSGLRVTRDGGPFWRRLVLALTLVAFAQAGYVTQTHIHPQALASRSAAETQHGKTPARDDTQHCPLCQEYLVAGAYLIPAPVVLPLPVVGSVFNTFSPREFPFLVTLSHAWQGRAPPRI